MKGFNTDLYFYVLRRVDLRLPCAHPPFSLLYCLSLPAVYLAFFEPCLWTILLSRLSQPL